MTESNIQRLLPLIS